MKNTVVVAGVAAAFAILAPATALAATPTTTPSAPTTTPATPSATPTATQPEYPEGPLTRITRLLRVAPAKALPGAHVKLDFACQTRGPEEEVVVQSAALVFPKPGNYAAAEVQNVKPGKYRVTLHCGPETYTVPFEVLSAAKQVAKVPSGAPQTGGTDGPADSGPLAAAAAMGVLAVGGGGLLLARRARRR
ncbi:hypothetical protein [Amycolatopsis sp. NPDC004625]|uniref:hypothetical protein n=1 Tax=Amycolatopsis sp. NPDC004625 TaxID=3154670 RepID=UPI0033ADAB6A